MLSRLWPLCKNLLIRPPVSAWRAMKYRARNAKCRPVVGVHTVFIAAENILFLEGMAPVLQVEGS